MSVVPERALDATVAAAAVGSGITAGVYFAFSTFVMRALDDLPGDRSIQAMQAINRRAVTPLFMTALFGTAAASVALGIEGIDARSTRDGQLLMAGASAYLASVALTVAVHVPRNERLAAVADRGSDAAGIWRRYSRAWTAGNHLRTACALAACALFVAAVGSLGR